MDEGQNIDEESQAPDIKQEAPSDQIIPAESNEKPETTSNMEVHHHPNLHHRKKHWREYLLEFLMIFLAVTLGFFAESYREYSVEKKRAAEYAWSLVHDLEKDTAMVRIDIDNINLIKLENRQPY